MLKDIIITYLIPLLIYGFITGAANLALSYRSQIETWAEANPRAAALQKLLRAIGLDPWNLVSAVSLWAKKRLPDAQQNGTKAVAALVEKEASMSPPPSDDDDTPRFPGPPAAPVIGLLLFVLLAAHSTACGGRQGGACDPTDAVRITEKYRASMSVQCKGYSFAECPYRTELETQRDKELEASCSKN